MTSIPITRCSHHLAWKYEELSRVLPLQPQGHQAARSPGCSLWRTPVTIITHPCVTSDSPGLHHFPDYLPICHSLWFLPLALLFLFLCHVCALFAFLILYYVVFIYLNNHSLNMLPDSQCTSSQNNGSPKGSIRECFFFLFRWE